MVSAPIDHFDSLLIEHTTTEWRKVARVIGDAMGANSSVYDQVGDIMLFARVVALIDQGKLVADGDPSDMHVTRVRLPDHGREVTDQNQMRLGVPALILAGSSSNP